MAVGGDRVVRVPPSIFPMANVPYLANQLMRGLRVLSSAAFSTPTTIHITRIFLMQALYRLPPLLGKPRHLVLLIPHGVNVFCHAPNPPAQETAARIVTGILHNHTAVDAPYTRPAK